MTRRKKTPKEYYLDSVFDYGFDRDNRTIWLSGDVEESLTVLCSKAFHVMKKDSLRADAKIILDSFGGCEYAMFAIYDIIKAAPFRVRIDLFGKAMSAGSLILSAGTRGNRYVSENSFVMIHEGWESIESTKTNIYNTTDHYKKLDALYCSLMSKNTNKSIKFFEDMKFDTFLSAKEVIKIGLADKIIKKL